MSKWARRVIVNYWKAGVIEGEILGFQFRVSIYKQITNPTWLSTWTLAIGEKEPQTVKESVIATATKIERSKRDSDRDEFGLLATDVVDNWDR
ncbi:Hypothetical predicted protein [Olea europaea subsp. europaea]|uniref:Uncharacterized protein n=1 Tax=Olea europaea subsp. europaea TaxID=158383 RepID=A0A8S0RCC8_OLEEU|nr:Hypothetical predicted protein [Olea europaea subsp. europaea]